MRVSKNFETSIYALLILGTQQEHAPLKSQVLSELLGVSDSALKKVLRKLVIAGFIDSTASKEGGFQLQKALAKISLLDVLTAVEDPLIDLQLSDLAHKVFPATGAAATQTKLEKTVRKGEKAFSKRLAKVSLADLLEASGEADGRFDWLEKLNH